MISFLHNKKKKPVAAHAIKIRYRHNRGKYWVSKYTNILAAEKSPTKGDFTMPQQEITVNLGWEKGSALKADTGGLGTCLRAPGKSWQCLGRQNFPSLSFSPPHFIVT